MQLEAISTVSVSGFIFQICRQFNDINSFERALLHTNTTANAKRFTDKGNFA